MSRRMTMMLRPMKCAALCTLLFLAIPLGATEECSKNYAPCGQRGDRYPTCKEFSACVRRNNEELRREREKRPPPPPSNRQTGKTRPM